MGEPGLTQKVGEEEITVTDDIGLPCDPAIYARRGCNTCMGRGVINLRRAMTGDEAKEQLGNARLAKGNWISNMSLCGCTFGAYDKARVALGAKPVEKRVK